MTSSFGLITTCQILFTAEEYLGRGSLNWQARTRDQLSIIRLLPEVRRIAARIPTLDSWARPTAEELNPILQEHGFDIRLEHWKNDGLSFGVVAVSDITVLWKAIGDAGEGIVIGGKPAFILERKTAEVKFYTSKSSLHPIVGISTQSDDDKVFIVKMPIAPERLGFLGVISRIRSSLEPLESNWDGVQIPMVKMDARPSMDWFRGIQAYHQHSLVAELVQVIQQIKFAMNQHGARNMEATAGQVRSLALPDYYIVDGPFLAWLERPGIQFPLWMHHITEESWMDPGDLSQL